MQDGDDTDGHYITMFAEQLTRTFEVLVLSSVSLLGGKTDTLVCYERVENYICVSHFQK